MKVSKNLVNDNDRIFCGERRDNVNSIFKLIDNFEKVRFVFYINKKLI